MLGVRPLGIATATHERGCRRESMTTVEGEI